MLQLRDLGQVHVPTTVGHGIAGTIAEIGENVPSHVDQNDETHQLVVGDRVYVHSVLNCQHCVPCVSGNDNVCQEAAVLGLAKFGLNSWLYDEYHDGGAAGYVKVPYWLLDPLTDNVSFEVAVQAHNAATALHVLNLANIQPHSTLLVTAPTGAMGALTIRLAEHFPIKKIILVGRSKERLEAAAFLTLIDTKIIVTPPSSIEDSGQEEEKSISKKLLQVAPTGVNAIIDYLPTGNLLSELLPSLVTGGTVVQTGGNFTPISISWREVMNNCWTIIGNRAHTRKDVQTILQWLSEGSLRLDDLITHSFSLLETDEAISAMEDRSEPMWLSVIEIPPEASTGS